MTKRNPYYIILTQISCIPHADAKMPAGSRATKQNTSLRREYLSHCTPSTTVLMSFRSSCGASLLLLLRKAHPPTRSRLPAPGSIPYLFSLSLSCSYCRHRIMHIHTQLRGDGGCRFLGGRSRANCTRGKTNYFFFQSSPPLSFIRFVGSER